MKVEKIQNGVVAELNGKFWGVVYKDGHCTSYGWVDDIEKVEISDPEFCKDPTYLTYSGSQDIYKLKQATLRKVKITTTYEIS